MSKKQMQDKDYGAYSDVYSREARMVFNMLAAAKRGDLDAVQMYHKAGASIDAANTAGVTVYDLAEKYGHQNIVRYVERVIIFNTIDEIRGACKAKQVTAQKAPAEVLAFNPKAPIV